MAALATPVGQAGIAFKLLADRYLEKEHLGAILLGCLKQLRENRGWRLAARETMLCAWPQAPQ
jgi:hypothetical protein